MPNGLPPIARFPVLHFGLHWREILRGKVVAEVEIERPDLGIDARLTLEKVPLEYFRPVIERTNLSIRSGTFSGSGRIEYAPNVKVTHLGDLTIQGMEIDYVHTARTAEAEKRRAEEVGKVVKEAPKAESCSAWTG